MKCTSVQKALITCEQYLDLKEERSNQSKGYLTIKRLSYFTLILPFMAWIGKISLRSYLYTYHNSAISQDFIKTRIPDEIIHIILGFLSPKDQKNFRLTAVFIHDLITKAASPFLSIKQEIKSFPKTITISEEKFAHFFCTLISSSSIAHLFFWSSMMNAVMDHFGACNNMSEMIQKHQRLAVLLETSKGPISSDHAPFLYNFFIKNILPKNRIYTSYQILEKYLTHNKKNADAWNFILDKYLNNAAKNKIYLKNASHHRKIKDNKIHPSIFFILIDLKEWFEEDETQEPSITISSENPTVLIPNPIKKAILMQIEALQKKEKDGIYRVSFLNDKESNLPLDFALPLIQELKERQIVID